MLPHRGLADGAIHVLQVIGGPCVAEGDGLRVVKGSPNANYAAAVCLLRPD